MIAHVVLFRPKPTLSERERTAFVDALDHAFRQIPWIRRASVGKRLRLGRLYDERNTQQFPFVALLEFDSEADLRAYLDHPAHRALGEKFYTSADEALAFDFDLLDRDRVSELLR